MEKVGRRKLLPILSLLLGICAISFLIPGSEPIVSYSLGGTALTESKPEATVRPARSEAVESGAGSQPDKSESAQHGVEARKQANGKSSAAELRRINLRPAIETAADIPTARVPHATPKTRQHFGSLNSNRTRIANRLPDSQPLNSLPKAAVAPQPVFVAQWPLAKSLIVQLSDLKEDDTGGNLAEQCIEQLKQLHTTESLDSPDCADIFDQLKWLEENARTFAKDAPSRDSSAALYRVAYAIQRRVEIWEKVHAIALQKYQISTNDRGLSQDWTAILETVERELRPINQPEAWRTYLLLDDLQQAFTSNESSASDRRQVAQQFLRRLASPKLTATQKKFLGQPAFDRLRTELGHWASEPVDYASIMRQLEEYESGGTIVGGDRIVAAQRALLLSPSEEAKELARKIDIHYRNANLRIAVSGELINRLLPQQQPLRESVRDQVLGASVRGVSEGTNRLRIRLFPDRERWRVGIESQGEGNSQTEAERGPVVFQNQGRFRVNVRKLLLVDRRGVRAMQAEAEAESENEVTDVSTDFDKVPLVGAIVRSMAMNQQANSARDAEWEVNRRLEALASRRMDEEVQSRLEEAEEQFKSEWIEPIRRLGLDPKPIQMQTTSARLIARYRLASKMQLSAFTPRPMALTDSWFSMQVHQSALNNVIRQLDLDGEKMELRDLYRRVAEKLGRDGKVPDDVPQGATIQFAAHDGVRLACKDGRIRVTLRIAELKAGRKAWRRFTVQVNYIVDVDGLDVKAKRDPSADDYIAVQGVRRLGNRIAIATIFSKVFANDREFPILPEKMATDERLKDLSVRQLVVDNGWIGISLVPGPIVHTVGQQERNASSHSR